MLTLQQQLSHDLDKISLMRRIFTQRAATRDGIFLSQLPVMRYISKNPGCTQKDVADFMKVSPPSIAVMVKRMVRDGVLKKEADEHDMRQNRLIITEAGLEAAEQCKHLFDNLDQQLYAGFTEEELGLLSSFLTRLINTLICDEMKNVSNHALICMMKELECGHSANKNKEGSDC